MSEEKRNLKKPHLHNKLKRSGLLNLGTPLYAGIGLLVAITLIGLIAGGADVVFALGSGEAAFRGVTINNAGQTSPRPLLQTDRDEQLEEYLQQQEEQLNSYGWVDRDQNLVRIPIDLAMEILAQEEFPVVEEQPETGLDLRADESGFIIREYEARTPPEEASNLLPEPGDQEPLIVAEPEVEVIDISEGDPEAGLTLFESQGCNGCHGQEDTPVAPTLVGIFGEMEELENGETVEVDPAYLRESILQPNNQIVAGYQPVMPSYEGRLSEEEIADLLAYIQSLGNGN